MLKGHTIAAEADEHHSNFEGKTGAGPYSSFETDRLRATFKTSKDAVIMFPFNVSGLHWVAVIIDSRTKTWSIGNSTPGTCDPTPAHISGMCALAQYIGAQFVNEKSLKMMRLGKEIGKQSDSYSCGPATLNAMAALLLGEPIFDASHAYAARLIGVARVLDSPTIGSTHQASVSLDDALRHFSELRGSLRALSKHVFAVNESASASSQRTLPDATIMSQGANVSRSAVQSRSASGSSAAVSGAGLNATGSSAQAGPQGIGRVVRYSTIAALLKSLAPERKAALMKRPLPSNRKDIDNEEERLAYVLQRNIKYQEWMHQLDGMAKGSAPIAWDLNSMTCGHCGKVVAGKHFMDTTRLKEHLKGTDCAKKNNGQTKLNFFVSRKAPAKITPVDRPVEPAAKLKKLPCPGLSSLSSDHQVTSYLQRTGAKGGGHRPRFKIIAELIPEYRQGSHDIKGTKLSKEQTKMVNIAEQNEYKWRNDHDHRRLFSTECTRIARFEPGDASFDSPMPCSECESLRHNRVFRQALSRTAGEALNERCVPMRYRQVSAQVMAILKKCPEVAKIFQDGDSKLPVAVRFAMQLGKGKIRNGDEAILAFVDALTVESERAERGKSMRGYQRSQALLDLEMSIGLISPKAYRKWRNVFGGSTHRHHQ